MHEYDVVIIGAGHNGWFCAAYLLKAGYSVLLREKTLSWWRSNDRKIDARSGSWI
jgi:glycine/D-amino acid oxidase-like deaminating enzyme